MATKTQIYKEVLREYDALRTMKAAELRERREVLYAKLPRLEEIERELSILGVSTAKLVLMQPESREVALAELQEKQEALKTERDALMAKNCLSPSLLKLEYACDTCKDTGYVGDALCLCMKHKLMDRLYDQSNVRDIIKTENFDTFDLRLFSDQVVAEEGISPRVMPRKICVRQWPLRKILQAETCFCMGIVVQVRHSCATALPRMCWKEAKQFFT